jgi:predicted CopG family antitoxin
MTQKTISVPDWVYKKLKAKKRENETFPDFFLRLLNEKEESKKAIPLESFFGALEDESNEWEEIEKKIYKARDKPRIK